MLDSAAAFLRQIILDQFGVSPQPDFDALDNPYSVRGGTIRYAPPSGGSPHFRGDRRVLVHVDDANVRGAIYSVVYPRSNTVGVGLEPTEEVLWVIDGTDVMLPRDTIGETFRDEGIRRAILKHVAGTMRLKR